MKHAALAGVLAVSVFGLGQALADPAPDHRDGAQAASSHAPAPAQARPAAAGPAAQGGAARGWGGPAGARPVQPGGAAAYGQPAYGARTAPAYGQRGPGGASPSGQGAYAPQRGGAPANAYGQGGYAPQRGSAASSAYGQGGYAPQRGAAVPAQGYGARAAGNPGAYRQGAGQPAFGAPGFAPGGAQPRYQRDYFPRTVRYPRPYAWRGEWVQPPGYYYRRWAYGEFLPWGWYEQPFWILDYYDYDLPVPPYGFAWIRVGPDVVLVNLATGMVVETVYGVFD